MSVTDRTRAPTTACEESLWGWGRVAASRSRVFRPRDVEDVVQVLFSREQAGSGVIARGAGRSYGDAAQNDGGDVLDMTGLRRILSIDGERPSITAQAGATVA